MHRISCACVVTLSLMCMYTLKNRGRTTCYDLMHKRLSMEVICKKLCEMHWRCIYPRPLGLPLERESGVEEGGLRQEVGRRGGRGRSYLQSATMHQREPGDDEDTTDGVPSHVLHMQHTPANDRMRPMVHYLCRASANKAEALWKEQHRAAVCNSSLHILLSR